HPQATLAKRRRMLLAPRQHHHLGDACEMGSEQAADRAGAGDADARHADLARSRGRRSSRPPVRPDGLRMSTAAMTTPTTISAVPDGRSTCQPRTDVPFSATASQESSALTASAPTTAPKRLPAPPTT